MTKELTRWSGIWVWMLKTAILQMETKCSETKKALGKNSSKKRGKASNLWNHLMLQKTFQICCNYDYAGELIQEMFMMEVQ